MKNLKTYSLFLSAVLLLFHGCTAPFLAPYPKTTVEERPDQQFEPIKPDPEPERAPDQFIVEDQGLSDEIDFALAFVDAPQETQQVWKGERSYRYPPLRVEKRPVRVMIQRNISAQTIYSPVGAKINFKGGSVSFRGRVHLQALSGGARVSATVNDQRRDIPLPCTLVIQSSLQYVEIGERSYRGNLVVLSENISSISLVNVLDVEDYLRGVVPREIGRLGEAEMEAMKSQAVAARTYTYVRMAANANRDFDVLSTVADQVYGGANDEFRHTDVAIRLTKDLIMAYNDQVIHAYYHSTCGGKTANVQDVWGQHQPYPYLRSVSDLNENGDAYCRSSRLFTWQENWTPRQLSSILSSYSQQGRLATPYTGAFRTVTIQDRFDCGRIKSSIINSTAGDFLTGGDRIRFLFRRNNSEQGILYSSNFSVASSDGNRVVISGTGFGHGVGMCQVGAIGRSRAGQTFDQILSAYYSGVQIRTAVAE